MTLRHHFTCNRLAKIQNPTITSVGRVVGKQDLSYIDDGNVNNITSIDKNLATCSKISHLDLLFNPPILLLEIHPEFSPPKI